jgi:hypothetical protein
MNEVDTIMPSTVAGEANTRRINGDGARVDAHNRVDARDMTDRELLQETVTRLREFDDLFRTFADQMQNNPMLRAMMPKI